MLPTMVVRTVVKTADPTLGRPDTCLGGVVYLGGFGQGQVSSKGLSTLPLGNRMKINENNT